MSSPHEYYSERIERPVPLSAEDERELFVAYRRRRTAKRREEITRRFLYWAAEIACRYCGPRMPKADAISAGNLGLMQAIEDFDPDKGKRFTTHSYFAIRRTVLVALRDTYIVNPSPGLNAARHVFNKTDRSPEARRQFTATKRAVFDDVAAVEIPTRGTRSSSTTLGHNPMNGTFSPSKSGIRDEDTSRVMPAHVFDAERDFMEDDCRAEADRTSLLEFVRGKIDTLPVNERRVMSLRYLGAETPLFREIGVKLKMEEDHVRYLHDRALLKLRELAKKEIE